MQGPSHPCVGISGVSDNPAPFLNLTVGVIPPSTFPLSQRCRTASNPLFWRWVAANRLTLNPASLLTFLREGRVHFQGSLLMKIAVLADVHVHDVYGDYDFAGVLNSRTGLRATVRTLKDT